MWDDFSLVKSSIEKKGKSHIYTNLANLFINAISLCNLNDIGYTSNMFTWADNYLGNNFIQAKLDIFLVSNN